MCRRDDGLSRLVYLCYYPKQSNIGHKQRLRRMWTVLDTIWCFMCRQQPAQIGPPHDSYEVVVLPLSEMNV
jgi:hypothetical protein